MICGRDRAKGEARAASIAQQTGCRVVDVPADLNRVEDCRDVVAEADRSFGWVDTLVNAAGMTDRGTLLDTTLELFDQMCASNVRAPFFLSQDCVKLMLREPIADTIVNIGSMPALAGQSVISACCASKSALVPARNLACSRLLNGIRIRILVSRPQHRLEGVRRRRPGHAAVPRR